MYIVAEAGIPVKENLKIIRKKETENSLPAEKDGLSEKAVRPGRKLGRTVRKRGKVCIDGGL